MRLETSILVVGVAVASLAIAQDVQVDRQGGEQRLQYRLEESDPIPPEPDEPGAAVNELPSPPEADELIGHSRLVDANSRFTVSMAKKFRQSSEALEVAKRSASVTTAELHGRRLEIEGDLPVQNSVDLKPLSRVEDRTAAVRKIGRTFIEQKGALWLGSDPDVEYRVMESQSDRGGGAVVYERSFRGITLADGRVTVVVTNDGTVKRLVGDVLDLSNVKRAIDGGLVSEAAANDALRASLTPGDLDIYQRPELTDGRIGVGTLVGRAGGPAYLVWEIRTTVRVFYVDASTGNLLPY